MRSLFSTIVLSVITKADELKCPLLKCEDQKSISPVVHDLCFAHDKKQPTEEFVSHGCDWYEKFGFTQNKGAVVCEFNLLDDKFAWINERYQPLQSEKNEIPSHSILNAKRTEAYCKEVGAIDAELNNGRTCASSWQCISQNCKDGFCVGLQTQEPCHSHADCGAVQYCQKKNSWPFVSQCTKLRTSYEGCDEDFECPIAHYCWYASKNDAEKEGEGERQCLP